MNWVKHSARKTHTFLWVYRYFSKYWFACTCEICIWKMPISRCAGLAPAYEGPWAGSMSHMFDGLVQGWGWWLQTRTSGAQEWQTPSHVCCAIAQSSFAVLLEQTKHPPGSRSSQKKKKKSGNCFGSQIENCFETCCENVVFTSKVTCKSPLCNDRQVYMWMPLQVNLAAQSKILVRGFQPCS